MQWRGPNRYDLKLGSMVVGAGLKVPGAPWTEDYKGARAQFESPAGSSLELRLEQDEASAKAVADAQSYRHEHAVPLASPHRVVCEFTLVGEDTELLAALTKQCAELSIEFEPDPRASWAIELEPAQISMAERSQLSIRYRVTNESDTSLDAKAYSLDWKLDAESSMSLNMAFGNGSFERRWQQLPPGETVDDRRVGVHLVDAPGEYSITLHHLEHEVARASLRVTP